MAAMLTNFEDIHMAMLKHHGMAMLKHHGVKTELSDEGEEVCIYLGETVLMSR